MVSVWKGFIEQPEREWTREELPPISEGFTVEDIKSRVLVMNKVRLIILFKLVLLNNMDSLKGPFIKLSPLPCPSIFWYLIFFLIIEHFFVITIALVWGSYNLKTHILLSKT